MSNFSNIWVIFKREYMTRITNKTFIIMTFLAPVLIAGFYALAIYIAVADETESEIHTVLVSDQSKQLKLSDFSNYKLLPAPDYDYPQQRIDSAKAYVNRGICYAWLQIDDKDLTVLDSTTLYSEQAPSLTQMESINQWISNQSKEKQLLKFGIRPTTLDSLDVSGSVRLMEISEQGVASNSSSGLKSGIGFILAFLIYMFIFMYGAAVMRGAFEEKTNRIVEVIVSSVKPFQLMMGKILGIAAVGLTQVAAWVLVLIAIVFIGGTVVGKQKMSEFKQQSSAISMDSTFASAGLPTANNEMSANSNPVAKMSALSDFLSGTESIPAGEILIIFVLYFIGGYLLYASMFAAIGAAVNQETETQQFMLPITMPLVLSFVIAQSVALKAPNGSTAELFSMIPFTSPIIMVVRAPFGVPISQLLLSLGILILTFVFMVWLTSKIYRIGILSYGKKPSWGDLWKWIRQ
jgi:ABC-2 type transport system permease protein